MHCKAADFCRAVSLSTEDIAMEPQCQYVVTISITRDLLHPASDIGFTPSLSIRSPGSSGRVSPASSDSLSTVSSLSSLSSASGLQGRRMRPRTRHHGDNSHYNLFGDTVLGGQSTGTRRPLPGDNLVRTILVFLLEVLFSEYPLWRHFGREEEEGLFTNQARTHRSQSYPR